MITAFWIIGMLSAFVLTACLYRKIELGRLCIVAPGIYFCLFVLASGVLMWMDFFSLKKASFATMVGCLALMVLLWLRNRKEFPKICIAWKKYLPLLLLLVAFAFVSGEKSGLYPSGQDEGLYQMRAALYIGGYNNSNVVQFPEYEFILNDWEKQVYRERLEEMEGYYLLREDGVEGAGDVEGVLHGVATYPALLALWGKIFGYSNMVEIQTLFYLLTIGLTWLICDNLKMRRWVSYVMAIGIGLSPIVLWCSKNTLTEMFFTTLVCLFLELLTEGKKKRLDYWTVIPMAAACFYHVTLTVFLPLVVLLYIFRYLQSGRKKNMYALFTLMITYGCGISMMLDTSRHYVMQNFEMLFSKTKYLINSDNFEGVVWGAVIIVCLCCVAACLPVVRKAVLPKWKKLRRQRKSANMMQVIVGVLLSVTVVFFVYKGYKASSQDMWVMKMGVLANVFMTGFVMVPFALIGYWMKAKEMLRKGNVLMLFLGLLYSLWLFSGVLWVLIYYYFYYARYFAPFLIFVFVGAGFLLTKLKPQIMVPICAIGIGVMVWQSSILYTERDLTYCDFEIVENMASCIGEKDAVLIYDQGYHIHRLFALPLKGLTGASIYFLNPDALESQLVLLQTMHEDIFILQYDLGRFTEEDGQYRYVYRDMLKTSIYDTFVDEGMPYPREVVTMESPVALMLYLR